MSRFFVVRHGNTFDAGDQTRRIGARTDLPLTPSGIRQAVELGAWFARGGISPTRVLVGNLRRTVDTAALILAQLPSPARLDLAEWLTEIDHGPDEGLPEDQVRARVGADALQRWEAEGDPPEGWIVDRKARIATWRTFMLLQDGDTLLVTSSGVARFALLAAAGNAVLPRLKLSTGHFGIITCDEAGTLRVEAWDRSPG